jgi:very-short-patch-repair endonuclease
MEPYLRRPEFTNPTVLAEAGASLAVAALCRQGVRAHASDDITTPTASIEVRDLANSILLWQKEMRAALRPDVEFTRARVDDLDAKCRRVEDIDCWFDQKRTTVESYVDPQPTIDPATLERMSRSFTVAGLCKQVLAALGKEAKPLVTLRPDFRAAAKELLAQITASTSVLPPAFKRINEDWPSSFAGGVLANRASLVEVAHRAESLLSSMPRAREWVLLNRALERCATFSLSTFVESLGTISADDAPRVFERRFLRLWISSVLDGSRTLGGFTEAKGRDLIEKHRVLDERVRRLAIARAQMTASAASARVRAAEDMPESTSEVGVLRRELQKRKRIKPLRKLFAEIPHVLQALKPCLLMSPISVSTYLKPGVFHFDLVVFDEASQLPTAEAVPAILRASQVVVAGDPKQLPPTSFFEASLVPEEEEDDDEEGTSGQVPLESLLDDCVAVVPVFQECHLRWHYRSRDERLIKFSNHFFYDNKLITFPSANPAATGQGVRLLHVPDGVYDRGRSRTNRVEAKAVAKLALKHFDSYPERSLGIVALNLSQKEAIEDAIAEALIARPDLETYFEEGRHENVFVKSLENVQGDERDTMIISVGYGKDYSGGLSMNFGPINTEGGWRRLNVLVTRAKWECVLVSSLRARDLGGVNPNNRGAAALRSFLDFAERDSELPPEIAPAGPNLPEANDFEEAVRAALINRGLRVDMQVGASHYRIDLAVRDPRDDRRYLLGIECDGRTYHSSRTARDRDLLRQLVLQRMGWRIHRIWSTEWFHDPELAVAGILRSVEQARETPIEQPIFAPPADPNTPEPTRDAPFRQGPATRDVPRKHKPGQPYSVFQPSRQLTRDHLIDAAHVGFLAGTITDLIRVEGPIHRDLLLERLKVVHGVARAGSNVQANVERALQIAKRDHAITHDPRSPFYYVPGLQVDCFRLPNDLIRRQIEHIAPGEISLAILYLVEDQFGVIEDSLPTAVARLLGIERLRTEGAEPIRRVIEELVGRGSLRRNGMQVHVG